MNFQFFLPIILLFFTFYKRNRAFLFWTFSFALALVLGLRENIGTDYKVYSDIFQGKFPVTGIDIGFMVYALAFYIIDDSGKLGMLVTAIITVIFHLSFIRKFSLNFWLSLTIFICLPIFFLSTLNLVRAHFAISIGLISVIFYIDKRYFLSLLLIALSTTMHVAGIIFLVIFLQMLVSKKFILISIFAIFLVFLLVFFTNIEVLIDYYLPQFSYFSSHLSENSPLLAGAFLLLNFGTLFSLYIQKEFSKIQRVLVMLNLLTILFLLLWFVSDYSNLWLRFSNFTSVHLLITIPFLFESLKPLKIRYLLRMVFSFGLIFLYVGYWLSDPSFGFKL